MSSKNHFQEFQFSKVSESRQKIDAQYNRKAADITSQKKGDSLEYDYRKSLAWDSAFFTSPGVLEPEELFQTLSFRPSRPLEQERTSSVCQDNSRRSLAWDNAFFTSAGVLNPEELSLVNKGYRGSGRYLVPDTEEKNWSSAGTDSTAKSDGFHLASLENDLFDDLKAAFDNSTTMKSLLPASNKQKHNTNNASERIAKSTSLPPQAQNIARGGNCNPLSSLKSPNVPGRVSPLSTDCRKRASLGPKPIKMENKATKTASGKHSHGQHLNVAKRPFLAESCCVIPNATASSKSTSSGSHTPTNESAELAFPLSDQAARSPLSSRLSSSPFALRNLSAKKIDILNSSLPCHLPSSFKSFYVSPASSVHISSSELLASISQISENPSGNLDTTPCIETSFDGANTQALDSESHHHNEGCIRHENPDTRSQTKHLNKKAKGSNSALKNVSRNTKPSGLRMPSPKIGFFDAENSMALTPNEDLKFHLGTHSSSKTGTVTGNCNGASERTIPSKLQKTETGNMKLGSERNRVLFPSGVRSSDPAPLKEDKGTQGFMANRKGMKNEDRDSQRDKKQKDSRAHCSRKILQIIDDDKENLCASITKLIV
ncbi:hypothetical protein CICLE_v10033690mg [Citrus x clementina]|uniref:Uncharacterized protein n=1 Tax=Citrus clementina TaxID=85681 RepID=V4SNR8_CITCL|nr:hypothetical protein CICLE_v10033690mg [Citrus x clementina]